MLSDLVDRVAQVTYRAACETKRAQGYHLPGECENRFGCEKCRRDLRPWDELPECTQDEFRSAALSVVYALGMLEYTIVPSWWISPLSPSTAGAMRSKEETVRQDIRGAQCRFNLEEEWG